MTKTQKIIQIPSEYKPLFDKDWREAAVYGGRYSLKSHTVARVLLIRGRQEKLRIACFREFQNSIADSSHQLLSDLISKYELDDYKITDKSIINTITGTDFLFKGLHHNEQNIKSTEGIDIAWVEEAQTVSKSSLEVLTPTVRKHGSQIIYTYNRLLEDDPVHTRLVIEGRPDTLIINANYDIAVKYDMMPDNILKEIEDDKKNRPALYRHKWLGEPNSLERKIYRDWKLIDEIPHEARLERYGLDFGYSNDPTSLVAVYYYNGGYILDEIIYQKGLSNKQIADIILMQDKAMVVADSAEPKSIDEIKSYGIMIKGADKGRDSIVNGINAVQEQKISITKRSVNTIKEFNNYLWDEDRDGKLINKPQDLWNHCFSPETLIYTTKGKIRIKDLVGKEGYLYSKGGVIKRFYDVKQTRKNAEMVKLEFEDGNVLSVTPDHLLLKPDNTWIEAGLLSTTDMIQSVMYEETGFQWKRIQTLLWGEIFQSWKEAIASCCLGTLQWFNSKRFTYSPQGWELSQQRNRELGTKNTSLSSFRTHDTREERKTKRMDRKNQTFGKQVAWVKRGDRVAQATWKEDMGRKKTIKERLCSLPYNIYNFGLQQTNKILPSKLQNESKEKKIKRITRGFCPITYNLEVEGTHCLLANGVIAHNSMDAIRYAISTLAPIKRKAEIRKQIGINYYNKNIKKKGNIAM